MREEMSYKSSYNTVPVQFSLCEARGEDRVFSFLVLTQMPAQTSSLLGPHRVIISRDSDHAPLRNAVMSLEHHL